MATAANTLFTLEQVRTWVGITDAADTSQDTVLERIADAVSAFLERETLRVFVSRTVTEILDGDGGKMIYLRHFPLTAFTSLTIRRSPTDASPETISTDSYRAKLSTGQVDVHSTYVSRGVANVTAVYTAGYAAQGAAGLPQDIVRAGLDLVKLIYDEKAHNAVSASSVSLGGMNFMLKPSWPSHIQKTIDNWKRVSIV